MPRLPTLELWSGAAASVNNSPRHAGLYSGQSNTAGSPSSHSGSAPHSEAASEQLDAAGSMSSNSVLSRFLSAPRAPPLHPSHHPPPSSVGDSSAAAAPPHASPSTLSSTISALYPRVHRGSSALPPPPPRGFLKILPLPATRAASAQRFLVVAPPFAIAVDGAGQPDAARAVLDVQDSLRDTPLGSQSVTIVDAAVAHTKLFVAVPSWLLMCAAAVSWVAGSVRMSQPHGCGLQRLHARRGHATLTHGVGTQIRMGSMRARGRTTAA